MGKIAFVFAGQGAQAPGMGKEICESSAEAAKVFEAADSIRPGTSKQCFEAPEEVLQETKNTQPCLFTVEMAVAAALEEAGIHADIAAGFSLGELAALTYAGVMDFSDGLHAVMQRAELMQTCAEKDDTAMAAVIKLSNEEIEHLCAQYKHIYPVNFNCPGQTSVSGDAQEMVLFAEAVKEAGGRAKILKVNGAFHSPYMTEAAEAFAKVLADMAFKTPKLTVYSNYTGKPYGEEIRDTLSAQIDHPVKWEVIVRNMITEGVDTFIELGPGKTLCGLIKRIDADVKLFHVLTPEDLDTLKQEL